ncbi:MAG: site-specific integrase [Deltaproteobacteria bacterium]|jgi:integrase|nr:site-specific integrase [Deltaproteobacteria bacterium]
MTSALRQELVKTAYLPDVSYTRSGREFYPQKDIWQYKDELNTIYMDFTKFKCSYEIRQSIKKIICWYAENRSPSYTSSMFRYLLFFFIKTYEELQVDVTYINSEILLNYYSFLPECNKYFLGYISGLIKHWISMELPGVSQDCLALLEQLRIKGCTKGEAVLTHDPEHGAFTALEYQSLLSGLNTAYETGEMEREDFLLAWLCLTLGQRPIQFAGLKLCDFHIFVGENNEQEYFLDIPRAKQRHQLARESFATRPIDPTIGEILAEHIESLRNSFKGLLDDPEQAPMFPAARASQEMSKGFEFHRTSTTISLKIKQILSTLRVHSERTGDYLNITPTRARRSLGSRAAAEGHGELVIAELLDHTDIQNVGVYVQALPDMLERLNEALAFQLAPRLQAFAGVLIDHKTQAKKRDRLFICSPHSDFKPVGQCGRHDFCQSFAPIACYTCINFQAWMDGPHASILTYLLKERKRLLRSTDPRIASVNDRTIMAVAQVVLKCKEMKEKGDIVQ